MNVCPLTGLLACLCCFCMLLITRRRLASSHRLHCHLRSILREPSTSPGGADGPCTASWGLPASRKSTLSRTCHPPPIDQCIRPLPSSKLLRSLTSGGVSRQTSKTALDAQACHAIRTHVLPSEQLSVSHLTETRACHQRRNVGTNVPFVSLGERGWPPSPRHVFRQLTRPTR